jgi:2-iminobutanoate/2-iminopropanoate deaminase
MPRKAVEWNNHGPKGLPFSPAVRAGKFVYLSGQIGLDPATGALVKGGVAAETARILENIRAVLEVAGSSLDEVVKANVYLAHIDDYAAMNAAYAKGFEAPFPARTCVGVAALPLGARIEIEVVARRP